MHSSSKVLLKKRKQLLQTVWNCSKISFGQRTLKYGSESKIMPLVETLLDWQESLWQLNFFVGDAPCGRWSCAATFHTRMKYLKLKITSLIGQTVWQNNGGPCMRIQRLFTRCQASASPQGRAHLPSNGLSSKTCKTQASLIKLWPHNMSQNRRLWWLLAVVTPGCGDPWLWWLLAVVTPGCGDQIYDKDQLLNPLLNPCLEAPTLLFTYRYVVVGDRVWIYHKIQ